MPMLLLLGVSPRLIRFFSRKGATNVLFIAHERRGNMVLLLFGVYVGVICTRGRLACCNSPVMVTLEL